MRLHSKIQKTTLALLIGLNLHAQAQNPLFRNITMEDGLPSNEIYSIHKDSAGFLWFGSDRGVARFDGRSFQEFAANEGLGGNVVYDFYDHPKGGFLAFSLNRQVTLLKNGNFLPLKNADVFDRYPDATQVYRFFFYHEDELHARCFPTTFRFSQDSILDAPRYWNNDAFGGGNILFNHGDSLLRLHNDDTSLIISDFHSQKIIIDSALSSRVFGDFRYAAISDELTLLAGNGGLFLFDGTAINSLNFKTKSRIEILFYDHNGTTWIGTLGDGLYRSNDLNTWEQVMPDLNVTDIEVDQFGGIWVSTLKQGILYNPLPSASLINDEPYERISIHDNMLVVANDQGIIMQDLTDENSEKEINLGTRIFGLEYDEKEVVWLLGGRHFYGTISENGLVRSNDAYRFSPKAFCQHGELTIAASSPNLVRWSSRNLSADPSRMNLPPTWYSTIAFSDDGTLWASSSSETRRIHVQYNEILESYPFRMTKLVNHSDEEILIATANSGLWNINLKNNEQEQFSTANGLLSNRIMDLKVVGKQLIMLHDQGVSVGQFENSTLETIHFPVIKALMNDMDQLFERNGQWIIGNGNLIVSINEDDLPTETLIDVSYDLIVNDSHRTFDLATILELEPELRNLRFEFDYPWFQSRDGLAIRYRMQEEDEWRSLNGSILNREISPGDYIFEAQYRAPHGTWISIGQPLQISLLFPIWQRWWFILLAFLAATGLTTFAIRFIIQRNLRKKNEKEQIQVRIRELQLKALKSQLNPHFIFNSINSLQYFISKHETEIAEEYVRRFSHLLRLVLENSDKQTITLSSELKLIELMVNIESMKTRDGEVELIINHRNVNVNKVFIPPFLFQPYVENALWHGLRPVSGKKTLQIALTQNNDTIMVSIEDNGIGRTEASKRKPKSTAQKSFGMLIASRRIQALNQAFNSERGVEVLDLSHPDGSSAGTRVEVTIPIITEDHESTHS